MKSCLVLEGGAKRGIYTAGVLDVFTELVKISKMETNPDIVSEMYNLGRQDGLAKISEIKAYLSS